MGRAPKNLNPRSKRAQRLDLQKIQDVIGKDTIRKALEGNPDPRAQKLIAQLSLSTYRNCSLNWHAQRAGLPLGELKRMFAETRSTEAMLILMDRLPEVVADIAEDAKSRMRACPICDGVGSVWRGEEDERKQIDCPECEGKGRVRVIGDKDARRSMLEAAGFVGKGGMTIVNQPVITGHESFEDTIAKVQKGQKGLPAATITAEVVDEG